MFEVGEGNGRLNLVGTAAWKFRLRVLSRDSSRSRPDFRQATLGGAPGLRVAERKKGNDRRCSGDNSLERVDGVGGKVFR